MSAADSVNDDSVQFGTSKSAIFIQNACLQHRYIRSKDITNIVERPERLRAIGIGLSAAIARLEELFTSQKSPATTTSVSKGLKRGSDANELADVLNNLKLDSDHSHMIHSPVTIFESQETIDILNHPAVKFVHGDIERDVYLENLTNWAKQSYDKIAKGESEIIEGLSQGDLYLCPGSIDAMQGAIATVCEAVDKVIISSRSVQASTSIKRAFVAVRPPGHHCGEDTPSGFCFVNNVAVGAAHAHLRHGIKRIVILDIDLHHGNGTQSIAWQINEETYRQTLESEGGAPESKIGPQIYYGSIHDILSYPCEDGKANLVQAASVSIHKSHGQYIENVHLQTYTSEEHFWNVLYKEQYSRLLGKAQEFLDDTGGPGDDVMVFISCGMDACEHEYESMSRHNRKVPASFYYRFARDTSAFSDKYARGRVVSVLEGGYSDRALISGAMAHLSGLTDVPSAHKVNEEWWSVDNLTKLEAATKKRRGGRPSLPSQGALEPWLERTLAIFAPLDASASLAATSTPRAAVPLPPSSRTLRDRSKGNSASTTPGPSPSAKRTKPSVAKPVSKAPGEMKKVIADAAEQDSTATATGQLSSLNSTEDVTSGIKKLPRVILRLGKPPEASG
ncbi:histone deacetylase domain-containing protein [Crassisporium funariophilum]|nr:histone deacetylase domain-containing protein [Crassisporium funariophilum]